MSMIHRFLKSKKGVTLLEGLIALMLLALVASASFAVLLSASRKSGGPDIREEMALAVERATKLLQAHVFAATPSDYNDYQNGLCGGEASSTLSTGTHNINCMLPPICDRNNGSSFSYTVSTVALKERTDDIGQENFSSYEVRDNDRLDGIQTTDDNVWGISSGLANSFEKPTYKVQFDITCNGFTL